MKKFAYVIREAAGLHARIAGMIVTEAMSCKSQVQVCFGERTADARDLIALMGLYADRGCCLEVIVSGEDEETAYEAVKRIFMKNL